MRVIVYGVGAIGGAVAAAIALSGQEVVGIARGAQLAAIQTSGLLLRTPDRTARAAFTCVADPTEIEFRDDDVVLLTMKTQDTLKALDRLRTAGLADQPIFCVQNGVSNERFALRRFPHVHGVTVMMPASYSVPGEVCVFSTPRLGIFDIGRYPSGRDAADENLALILEAASIASFVIPDVMASKHGKLLLNLNNILEAALGVGVDTMRFHEVLRAEAEAVYTAAGISYQLVGGTDPRRDQLMRQAPIEGVTRSGGSTTQSLARGSGSLETDYLNGEIVLLGRLHGVPVPANTFVLELSSRMLREDLRPGAISFSDLESGLAK